MGEFNYQTLKVMAKSRGQSVTELLAMSPRRDPFYVGTPAQVAQARWFAELWQKFGYRDGIHLRLMHYRTANGGEVFIKPDGKPYENTENCWDYLVASAQFARYLGLVDPDAFVDRRNPAPIINARTSPYDSDPEPSYEVYGDWDDYGFELPELPSLPALPGRLPDLPSLEAGGYEGIKQDYLIEIWAEKTTMNRVLEPVCRDYGANLVTGAGELSITAVRQFLKRAKEAGRPARILYISDFDPAGNDMPISVARKIEFYQRNNGVGGLDIALQPIVLTADQVRSYRLPRVPVKDTDRRKDNFEDAYGEGQVELDALEALYPGKLAEIVTDAILDYYDPDLWERAHDQKNELQTELDNLRQAVRNQYDQDLASLSADYAALQDDFEKTRSEFTDKIRDFAPRIEAHQERLESIKARAADIYGKLYKDLESVEVDLDDYPLPEPDIAGDPEGLLYSSERDYSEQLEAYKARQTGEPIEN